MPRRKSRRLDPRLLRSGAGPTRNAILWYSVTGEANARFDRAHRQNLTGCKRVPILWGSTTFLIRRLRQGWDCRGLDRERGVRIKHGSCSATCRALLHKGAWRRSVAMASAYLRIQASHTNAFAQRYPRPHHVISLFIRRDSVTIDPCSTYQKSQPEEGSMFLLTSDLRRVLSAETLE